jgi:DNA-binding NarL/FixJ family response regulator
MDKIKIVVVDDHQMFLDGVCAVLSSQKNMEILFTENSAVEALKKIKLLKKKERPNLVITDVSMPAMNGLEFVKILKKEHAEIRILVLSMFEYLQSYDDIDGFLLKETDKDKLIYAIEGIALYDEKHFVNKPLAHDKIRFNKNILSKTETEILQLIAKELTTEEIAAQMGVNKSTVEFHRKNIYFKLDIKNIAGLVRMGVYLGIIH